MTTPSIKWIERVRFNIKEAEKRGIIDRRFLLIFAEKCGIHFPEYHFNWLEKNGLIIPFRQMGGKNYYSHFQIPLLDMINDYKVDTLESPNPRFCPGLQLTTSDGRTIDAPGFIRENAVTWQDHIIANKEIILKNNEEWNKYLHLIHLINELYEETEYAAFKWYKEDEQAGSASLADHAMHRNTLKRDPGQHYTEQINSNTSISSKIIRYWATSTLSAYVVKHNPLYQYAFRYPQLEEVFKIPNAGDTIFNKNNGVATANFYRLIMGRVDFYLECLEGKGIGDIKRILATAQQKGIRKCAICSSPFIPRTYGRENVICPNNMCQKERDKMKAKERRLKARVKIRASV